MLGLLPSSKEEFESRRSYVRANPMGRKVSGEQAKNARNVLL